MAHLLLTILEAHADFTTAVERAEVTPCLFLMFIQIVRVPPLAKLDHGVFLV